MAQDPGSFLEEKPVPEALDAEGIPRHISAARLLCRLRLSEHLLQTSMTISSVTSPIQSPGSHPRAASGHALPAAGRFMVSHKKVSAVEAMSRIQRVLRQAFFLAI